MFESILEFVTVLTGFAFLITFIINTLKVFNVVKDGTAHLWSAGANLILILVVYIFKLFRPEFDFQTIDPIANEIATVGTFILSYVVQLIASKGAHKVVKGLPVVGKTYSP